MNARFTLPQTEGGLFLTDGGIETTLIFQQGFELPQFAAFVLLANDAGRDALRRYYRPYLEIASAIAGAGFVLESPTWRASADWGVKLDLDAAALRQANLDALALMHELRAAWRGRIDGPIVISGCIGPRGDGYRADPASNAADATAYHAAQAHALRDGGADLITAITMTTSAEAIGVARAAKAVGLPSAISFTLETDGRLPSGERLRDAIETVDADTAPAYYMINCAHPTHFEAVFDGGAWTRRIRGLRANASTKSHAELDEATALDSGDPADLGDRYRRLRAPLPALNVLGGCCGTDARHVEAICRAW